MANGSCPRFHRPPQPDPGPQMRRWPHPVARPEPECADPALHYLRCSLSYQNQLLSELKVLLTQTNALLSEGNALLAPPGPERGAEPR